MEITQELLNEMFEYRDGDLIRKTSPRNSVHIGDVAGSINNSGYIQTNINKKAYKNHRLIFLMHYGYLPKYLDHKDGDRKNNHIENLREATWSQNQRNTIKSGLFNGKLTTSTYKGVSWHKHQGKWRARIYFNEKTKELGYFTDEKEAANAYNLAAIKYHGEFARLNDLGDF